MGSKPYEPSETSEATEPLTSGMPTWLWGMGGLAILWNLMGLLAFVAYVVGDPKDMASTPEEVQLYLEQPIWYKVCFAAAVIGGTLGSIALFMGRKWAVPLFAISLLGLLGQQTYLFVLSDTLKVMGTNALIGPVLIDLIAIWLMFVAWQAMRNGQLR